MQPITFFLADDSNAVRQELRRFVASNPQWRVTAEAGDGLATLRLVNLCHPDVVLVDVAMPRLDGIRVAQTIKASSAATRVIIYTAYHSATLRQHALAAGADAFFWKEDLDYPVLALCVQQWFSGKVEEKQLCTQLSD